MASLLWDVPRRRSSYFAVVEEAGLGTTPSVLGLFWTWQLAEGGLELKP